MSYIYITLQRYISSSGKPLKWTSWKAEKLKNHKVYGKNMKLLSYSIHKILHYFNSESRTIYIMLRLLHKDSSINFVWFYLISSKLFFHSIYGKYHSKQKHLGFHLQFARHNDMACVANLSNKLLRQFTFRPFLTNQSAGFMV